MPLPAALHGQLFFVLSAISSGLEMPVVLPRKFRLKIERLVGTGA